MIYRFNTIPVKIPASYFIAIDKLILKFMGRGKIARIVHTELKENKVGGPALSGFQTYHKAAVWYW